MFIKNVTKSIYHQLLLMILEILPQKVGIGQSVKNPPENNLLYVSSVWLNCKTSPTKDNKISDTTELVEQHIATHN